MEILRDVISEFGGFFKRPDRKSTIVPPQVLDTRTLREKYRDYLHTLNMGAGTLRHQCEEVGLQLIAEVPDQMQQGLLRCIHNRELSIEEIFEAQDKGDWTEPVHDSCHSLAKLLDGRRYEGMPSQFPRTPYSGEDMLIWMLSFAKQDSTVLPRISVRNGTYTSINNGIICGKTFGELNLNEDQVSRINDMTLTSAFMDAKYAGHLEVFADFVATVPNGEEWLKGIILASSQSQDK